MSSISKPKFNDSSHSLEDLRLEIDALDKELITLLEKRAKIVFSVGEYKRKHNLPAFDPQRESKIKNRVRSLTQKNGALSPNEMELLFAKLIEGFRSMESAHMQKEKVHTLLNESLIDFSKSNQVILWGFGLLGSSLYLALKDFVPHWNFLIVDPHIDVDLFSAWKENYQAKNIDLINSAQMKQADIYVLSAAVDVNNKHLAEFNFPRNSFVFDLGSTKQIMLETFQKRTQSHNSTFYYIGGHPLAGKETSGFQNGDALLFYNKTFCWTPPQSLSENKKIQASCDILAYAVGATPYWTTALEHDTALAWTSHLPQLLSSTLALCLSNKKFLKNTELFPGIVSELLRVSGSSFSMWKSILSSNQPQLSSAITEVIKHLTSLQQNLSDSKSCENLFKNSNQFFKTFQDLKNKKGA